MKYIASYTLLFPAEIIRICPTKNRVSNSNPTEKIPGQTHLEKEKTIFKDYNVLSNLYLDGIGTKKQKLKILTSVPLDDAKAQDRNINK